MTEKQRNNALAFGIVLLLLSVILHLVHDEGWAIATAVLAIICVATAMRGFEP